MNVSLAYGSTPLTLELPENVHMDVFEASSAERAIGFPEFKAAFVSGAEPFGNNQPTLIIVNDAYRHTPTAEILDWLEKLEPGLIPSAHFLIATGSHQAPSQAQILSIFGSRYDLVVGRVTSHDATDLTSLVKVGVDSFGKDVLVNRMVLQFEQILIIGSVEPHYFAGFTGGRKSIFPGLNDLATIERNHNLANSLEAAPLRLKGNPVAEHLESLLEFLPRAKLVSIQVVADVRGRIAGAFVGDIRESFEAAAKLATELYARSVENRYDVILCELLSPLNKNLYQAQKALENSQLAVADGGAAIVVSPCDEGIGSAYFFELADHWDRERNEPQDGVPRFGSHKLSRVNAMSRRIRPCIHSRLAEDVVLKVYYEPVADLEAFVREAAGRVKKLRLAVVRDAGHTVLRMA